MSQNALASTPLYYDDGSNEQDWFVGTPPYFVGVEFVLADFGLSSPKKVLNVAFYISITYEPNKDVKIHVTDAALNDLLVLPLTHPSTVGWWTIDISSYNVIVTGDFYVFWEAFAANTALPALDSADPDHPRYYSSSTL